MLRMADTFVISGLRRKRARMAGAIEAAERDLGQRREELASLDAVIRLFSPQSDPELIPAIKPCSHRGLFFKHGEQLRLCFAALREADKPVSTRQVADWVLAAKRLDGTEGRVRAAITTQVRQSLIRMERRGTVRKIVAGPEAWWELAFIDGN
jgi:hypothetical protein